MRINAIYYLVVLGSLISAENAAAQNTNPYPSGTPVNYLRTWDAVAPETDGSALMTRPVKDVRQTTQYFDGLGRPLQTVINKGSLQTDPANPQSSASATDMVSPVLYDEFGRERYQYLPFASTENSGLFKADPFQQQQAFMQAQYGLQGETYFYGKTEFEASPLGRTEKTMAPGNSWVGSGRGVGMRYWVNTVADEVRIWNVSNSGITGVFGSYSIATTNGGVYAPGLLVKNITVDEHGKQVIEFKDKEGKVILKKVQLTALADDGQGAGYSNWLCTYYIYDELNRLRSVIQPEGVKWLANPVHNWVLSPADYNSGGIVAEQFFRYEYDNRGRMIMKKVPGAVEVYMVYDGRDRLVMTQDANLRGQNKWLVTKYDELNRLKETGVWNNNGNNFAAHLTAANSNSTEYPVTTSGYEMLTKTQYDSYSGIPVGMSYKADWNSYFAATDVNNWPYPQMPQMNTSVVGLATWTQTKILGTATFINTVSYYDDKGRVIQVQSTNISGGTDVVTTQYSWAGQPLISVQKQEKQGANAQTTVLVTKLSYDELGRLVKTEKKQSHTLFNSNIMSAYKTIAKNEYNKLGQLKKKEIGTNATTAAALETLNYDYNIRGWMLGVNRDYARDANSNNYFGFDLGYDKTNNNLVGGQSYNAPQYNGNISGMLWKSRGDGEKRKYDFSYDAANRLMKADFSQYTGGLFDQSAGINYNMKMGVDGVDVSTAYDDNGNILKMQQWGLKGLSSAQIDNLGYMYQTGSNKLARVTDAVTTDNQLGDFKDGANTGDDYNYDQNGNLIADNNKSISSIAYNYLNLPQTITVTGKGAINYTYDAAGSKLQKVTTENNATVIYNATNYTNITITTTTSYMVGFVYESKNYSNGTLQAALGYTDKLQFAGHEEGRIRPTFNDQQQLMGLQYDYMLKDHLGNVRMLLTEEQKQDIYPAATLENVTYNGGTAFAKENEFYTINTANIALQGSATGIPAYQNNNGNPPANNNPYSNTVAGSQRLYLLNATTNAISDKTGLGIALKVMAGDAVNIFGKSYHKRPAGSGYTNTVNNLVVSDIINSFAGNALVSGKGVTGSQITGQSGFPTILSGLIGSQPAQSGGLPRAAINWIIFDEQFKYVSGGFDMVGDAGTSTSGTFKNHNNTTIPTITIPKNGYIYVYCSNESKYNVFFDNLQVIHTRGAILEETHYYPFGLTMQGISSKALNGAVENKFKYNGYENNTDFDLNLYESFYRSHDPQLGRFLQIDPKAIEMESPYVSMGNNPIANADILGDTTIYYNIETGAVINTINNSGSVTRVKVAGTLYSDAAVEFKDADWSDQSTANDFVNSLNGTATYLESVGDGNVIAFETGELRISFDGTANSANPKQGDGMLNINSVFDDGSTVTVASYDAIGGPWGNGSPENGSYEASNLQNRTKSGWYNEGMNKDGVGFSLDLNPNFKTYRSNLRIHPDGGKVVGTLGCIGLTGDGPQLRQFQSTMKGYLKNHTSIHVDINIVGNPNNNGKVKVKTNMRE